MSNVNPPAIANADSDGVKRIRYYIWLIAVAAVTLLITAWFCTLGVFPAIISLLVAKHIFVAIVAAGLNMRTVRK